MKILLLEDDVALNRAIKKITELDAHVTDSYVDGRDVLDDIDDVYDLYILDINVPHVNGLELLKIINERNALAQVIIISANTDLLSIEKAYASGCIDYLRKPFHLQELRIKISKLNSMIETPLSSFKLKEGASAFTKQERTFLLLLLKYKELVNYEMIENTLYPQKTMSMDSLRALVKRVRAKLEGDIIKNVLQEGYRLEL